MPFSTAAKNTMLDALIVDRVQLHSGDPGTDGTANIIADTMKAATCAAASGGTRVLSGDVQYSGLTPGQSITHVSFWDANSGSPVFHGSEEAIGDKAVNAAGEYTVKATTKLSLTDPV